MNPGWIKLYRKLQNSDMYKSLNAVQRDVMIQLLLLANHKSNQWEWKGDMFTCKPGQFVTSLKALKNRCASDVTTQNIRTALIRLEKWQFLTNESTKQGRLITIVNWETYQGIDEDSQQSNQQTTNKQLTTNKNVKKDKDIYAIFNYWNDQKIIVHREFAKFVPSIKAKLKSYSHQEIMESISNYSQIIKGDNYYFSHRWTLNEFLTRKNGLDKFLTENNPFENFQEISTNNDQVRSEKEIPL